jgi:hypothetical protein
LTVVVGQIVVRCFSWPTSLLYIFTNVNHVGATWWSCREPKSFIFSPVFSQIAGGEHGKAENESAVDGVASDEHVGVDEPGQPLRRHPLGHTHRRSHPVHGQRRRDPHDTFGDDAVQHRPAETGQHESRI